MNAIQVTRYMAPAPSGVRPCPMPWPSGMELCPHVLVSILLGWFHALEHIHTHKNKVFFFHLNAQQVLQSILLSLLFLVQTLTESPGSKEKQCVTHLLSALLRQRYSKNTFTPFVKWGKKSFHIPPVRQPRVMIATAGTSNYTAAFIIVRALNRPKR